MQNFYCNKRYDISFSDFHKLIRICLPSNLTTRETRGIYKKEYTPCNIIEIYEPLQNNMHVANIYSWLGAKGLTVLADTELAVSLCLEVLKEVKQNPEDYKVLSLSMIDESILINHEELKKDCMIYKQVNSSDNTSKYIIREYNGDEVLVDFYYNPDAVRLSGSVTSLLTTVQLIIEKASNAKSEDTRLNENKSSE